MKSLNSINDLISVVCKIKEIKNCICELESLIKVKFDKYEDELVREINKKLKKTKSQK